MGSTSSATRGSNAGPGEPTPRPGETRRRNRILRMHFPVTHNRRRGHRTRSCLWFSDILHMKRCSMPLVTGEMQIETATRYRFTPTSTARIKRAENACWWSCRTLLPRSTAVRSPSESSLRSYHGTEQFLSETCTPKN